MFKRKFEFVCFHDNLELEKNKCPSCNIYTNKIMKFVCMCGEGTVCVCVCGGCVGVGVGGGVFYSDFAFRCASNYRVDQQIWQ